MNHFLARAYSRGNNIYLIINIFHLLFLSYNVHKSLTNNNLALGKFFTQQKLTNQSAKKFYRVMLSRTKTS